MSRRVEGDVALPTLSLVFEYQGEQHYLDNTIFGSLSTQQNRDKIKREWFSKAGLTLIEVPFWWDGRSQSLLATIHSHRPDLVSSSDLTETCKPISMDIPPSVLDRQKRLEQRRKLGIIWD